MEDKRKELESQIFYITQENLQLEQKYREGQEADLQLEKNREKLKDLMQDFLDA